jgi:putative ABC transport system permease protein
MPVAVGLALGVPGALALSGFIEDLLFGVTASDQTTMWTVTVLLAAVALLVCYVSARRATRIDAAVALRE